jgi:hypothetical protein
LPQANNVESSESIDRARLWILQAELREPENQRSLPNHAHRPVMDRRRIWRRSISDIIIISYTLLPLGALDLYSYINKKPYPGWLAFWAWCETCAVAFGLEIIPTRTGEGHLLLLSDVYFVVAHRVPGRGIPLKSGLERTYIKLSTAGTKETTCC